MKEAWDAHAARLTPEQLEFLLRFMIDSNELGRGSDRAHAGLPKPKRRR